MQELGGVKSKLFCLKSGWKGNQCGLRTARLSQMPWESLDKVLAEHGAMRTISAHLRNSM